MNNYDELRRGELDRIEILRQLRHRAQTAENLLEAITARHWQLETENEALREFAKATIRYAGNAGDDYLATKAREALGAACNCFMENQS